MIFYGGGAILYLVGTSQLVGGARIIPSDGLPPLIEMCLLNIYIYIYTNVYK